jgi:hypothetical protein
MLCRSFIEHIHADAPSGERALKVALLMLAKRGRLEIGDVLRMMAPR